MDTPVTDFRELTPEKILSAVESNGFRSTGRYFQLNSFENRVYEVELEGQEKIIAKFYRPQKWNLQALHEEHDFIRELLLAEVPAVDFWHNPNDQSIFQYSSYPYALSYKRKGRAVEELAPEGFQRIGQNLARIHAVGMKKPSLHRPDFFFGDELGDVMHAMQGLVPFELENKYFALLEEYYDLLDQHLDPQQFIRIHGDFHKGNIIQSNVSEFSFIDFDDFLMGPREQDIWMLFSSEDEEEEQKSFLKGYEMFQDSSQLQMDLFPLLRGYRLIKYSFWVCRRWQDPVFPKLFQHYESHAFWEDEILKLNQYLSG